MKLRTRVPVLAALAAACSAVLIVGLAGAGAAKPPASAKAWLGIWKARWGYVVFNTLRYNPPHSSQDFVWGAQGTWVYHGIHPLFGGVGPRSGAHANETFGGGWFMEDDTSTNSPLGSVLIFRSQGKFTGGYWKTCDYYCKSHHPWRGKHVGSCRTGCKKRKVSFSFSQRGRPDRAPQYIEYSRSKGGGSVSIPVNPAIKQAGMSFVGVEGKARGSATHLHTEHLSVDSFKKVRYQMQVKNGAAYARYRNGVQTLIVPVTVSGGLAKKTCKQSPGMLELTDGGRSPKKDRLILYVGGGGVNGFCGDPDTFRYTPPPASASGDNLKIKIAAR